MQKSGFIILDFGSQYTWLIARRFRELSYYSEVVPYDEPLENIKQKKPYGIILSGGPASVLEKDSPQRSVEELLAIAPVLGICYGMQLIAHQKGAVLERAKVRTYGHNQIVWEDSKNSTSKNSSDKNHNDKKNQMVWMSHGDSIKTLPPKAQLLAKDKKDLIVGFAMERLWAFQFHPEVSHTENGEKILKTFAEKICQAPQGDWSSQNIIKNLVQNIQEQVPPKQKVFCALSGGVDSTVTAVLLNQALPSQVHCLFVDTGLLRKNEYQEVLDMYKAFGLKVTGLPAQDIFLKALEGVIDPEWKRKIIGKIFIDIFKKEMRSCQYLAQGTLYPDVIESLSPKGAGVTIKSHHNVGGLPPDLNLELVEPLKFLFKDEVRQIGAQLSIPDSLLYRHPFPGPGLAVRILGAINQEDIFLLQEADAIYIEELKKQNLYDKIWQAFCVLLPVKSVGVQGDARSYEKTIALRAVTSQDGMTANWFPFPPEFLAQVSNRIINEVQGVNRIVYDITSKPPGTIEWE